MSIGIPIKLLHEAEKCTITVELKTGETFRGTLIEAEDNMNCQVSLMTSFQLANVQYTSRDGRLTELEHAFIRGSKVRFMILPDMLKNAAMFKRADPKTGKNKALGLGRAGLVPLEVEVEEEHQWDSVEEELLLEEDLPEEEEDTRSYAKASVELHENRFIIQNRNSSRNTSFSSSQQFLLITLLFALAASASQDPGFDQLLSLLNGNPLTQGPFTEVFVFQRQSTLSTVHFPRRYNITGDSLSSLSFAALEDGPNIFCEAKDVAVDADGKFEFLCKKPSFLQAVCSGQLRVRRSCHVSRGGVKCIYWAKTSLSCASKLGEGDHKIVVSYSGRPGF
ncbi:hypothetical protein PROFUN_04557 [Planoprotostelium fungivorum]|uniref:Sm domain-containing protein n=1 Tax=Planoprotostelium fungivorum TaxID=1890364 RepID=A0A2P6NBL2_9EUKA|nr:hypothetical protein PROFUN_04557 [Planoprotostelium fungivorum]